MKVDKKNNQRMRRVAIVGIILICLCFVLEFNNPGAAILLYITNILSVILIWYLITILQFAGEEIAVQTPFSIFLGISIISLLSPLFIDTGGAGLALGTVNSILVIYITIATFKISDKKFAVLFRSYSISLLIIVLTKLCILFVTPRQTDIDFSTLMIFITLLNIVPLYFILRIINTAGEILKNGETKILNEEAVT